jgi:hypothetical protein
MPKKNRYNPYQFKSKAGFKPAFNDLSNSTYTNDYAPMMFKNQDELNNHNDLRNSLLTKQKEDLKWFTNTGALASDIAVLGNYIPHPVAQGVGKAGIYGSLLFNGIQSVNSLEDRDYLGASLNALGAVAPMGLSKFGYLRDGENIANNSIFRKFINKPSGMYRPLAPLPNRIAPSVIKGINYNKIILGTDMAAIGYNSFGNGGDNDEWEVVDNAKLKFGNGGKDDVFQIPWTQNQPVYKPGVFNKNINQKVVADNVNVFNNKSTLIKTQNAQLNTSKIRRNPIWINNLKEHPIHADDITHGASNQSNLDFYNQWINSPMFNSMTRTLPISDKNKLKQSVKSSNPAFESNDLRLFSNGVIGLSPDKALSHNLDIHEGAYVKKDLDSNKKAYVLYHELSHQFDDNGKNIPTYYNQLIKNNYNNKKSTDRLNYIGIPTETRARLNTIRKQAYDDKIYDVLNKPATKEDVNKLRNTNSYKDLKERYDEDDILFLLNNVAKNQTNSVAPIGLNGLNNDEWEII